MRVKPLSPEIIALTTNLGTMCGYNKHGVGVKGKLQITVQDKLGNDQTVTAT